MSETIWDWLKGLDYGTVPAWLTAFSLLLAFRIFLRDRIAHDRSQVDLIGVWLKVKWELGTPQTPRVETGKYTRYVRNGSALPIEVAQFAFDIRTKWWVRDLPQWDDKLPAWQLQPGTGAIQMYSGKVRVPPDATWDSGPQDANFAHLAPEHADQVDLFEGMSYQIRWVLLTDNAGRRWEVRPASGGPARRIRWWSRRRSGYPIEWLNPVTFWLKRKMYASIGHIKSVASSARSNLGELWRRRR